METAYQIKMDIIFQYGKTFELKRLELMLDRFAEMVIAEHLQIRRLPLTIVE